MFIGGCSLRFSFYSGCLLAEVSFLNKPSSTCILMAHHHPSSWCIHQHPSSMINPPHPASACSSYEAWCRQYHVLVLEMFPATKLRRISFFFELLAETCNSFSAIKVEKSISNSGCRESPLQARSIASGAGVEDSSRPSDPEFFDPSGP